MQSLGIGMWRNKSTQFGFTLAEVLVVMFVIAITAGVMLFRAGDFTYGKSARDISRQLAAFTRVVQQEAILRPAVLGLVVTQYGYQVYAYDLTTQDWRPLAEVDNFWRVRKIPTNVQIGLDVDQKQLSLPTSVGNNTPQIIFSPSGEITPFVAMIEQRGKNELYQVSGSFAGKITSKQVDK